jgi:hypothetical protein
VSARTTFHVAGASFVVETKDERSARVVDALFANWYLEPRAAGPAADAAPAIVLRSAAAPPVPGDWPNFEVAGGGTCYTDGTTSVIAIGRSAVSSDSMAVRVWVDEALPLEAPALTRLVSYALAAALRQRHRFELHAAALVDPSSGRGVLITGPSGSGKSTLAVHLASAGWPYLTDDVLLLAKAADAPEVTAWPLRREFAVSAGTFAASRHLRARSSFDEMPIQEDGKGRFAPHDIFTADFKERCAPSVILFPTLTDRAESQASALSAGDTMARLIRMNPWSCYDRSTAAAHLAVLSALASQCAAYDVAAGRDLLDPEPAVRLVSSCARG